MRCTLKLEDSQTVNVYIYIYIYMMRNVPETTYIRMS